jgi:hypothetical protein
MKAIFTMFLFVVIVSCNDLILGSKKGTEIDSTLGLDEQKFMDSLKNDIHSQPSMILIRSDTIGMNYAPIKVISFKVVEKEYSTYRNVFLRYKNVSKKTVTAIRFRWYGVNAFGEPADLGNSILTGFGSGFTEDIIKPNASDSGEWDVLSRDAKKILIAYAYEVAFSDGSKWKSGKN